MMKKTLFTLLCSFLWIHTAFAVDLQRTKAGDVIEVTIQDIHPTQTSIGYKEVDYKINRFHYDREKMFADYCETAGAKDVKKFDSQSNILHPDSFTCATPFGENKAEMKTVVIAPNNQLYLTDGHHTFSVYDAISGDQVPVYVVVSDDFRKLANMDAFWATMTKRNLVLLNEGDKVITPQALPQFLGKKTMQNDEFRSLMYFAKDIGYKKPESAPPFLEFYWANWLRSRINMSQYHLNNKENYADAVKAISQQMVDADKKSVIATIDGKTYSAKDMGALSYLNGKKFNKLLSSNGKITYAFAQQ